MRRADDGILTEREREDLHRMLRTLVRVQEALWSFEDGEINLRDAVVQMAAVLSGVHAACGVERS